MPNSPDRRRPRSATPAGDSGRSAVSSMPLAATGAVYCWKRSVKARQRSRAPRRSTGSGGSPSSTRAQEVEQRWRRPPSVRRRASAHGPVDEAPVLRAGARRRCRCGRPERHATTSISALRSALKVKSRVRRSLARQAQQRVRQHRQLARQRRAMTDALAARSATSSNPAASSRTKARQMRSSRALRRSSTNRPLTTLAKR